MMLFMKGESNMRLIRLLVPLVVLLGVFAAPRVLGYIGQNPYSVRLDAPASVDCRDTAVVTATVRLANTGEPVAQQLVYWDFKQSGSPQDKLSPAQGVTDDNGKVRTTLSFGFVSGVRNVRITVASWPATIYVSCTGAPAATPSPRPTAPPPTAPPPTASSGATGSSNPSSGPSSDPTTPTFPATPPATGLSSPTASPVPTNAQASGSGLPVSSPTPPPSGGAGAQQGVDVALVAGAAALVLALGLGGLAFALRRR